MRRLLLSSALWALGVSVGLWCGLAAPGPAIRSGSPSVVEVPSPSWLEIFGHNTLVLGVALLGVFSFGLLSILTLFMSGLYVGLAFGVTASPDYARDLNSSEIWAQKKGRSPLI